MTYLKKYRRTAITMLGISSIFIVGFILLSLIPENRTPKKETWYSLIQQFDTLHKKNILYYTEVRLIGDKIIFIKLVNGLITNNDIIYEDVPDDPWNDDVTLKNGQHIKVEFITTTPHLSLVQMDSLRTSIDTRDDIEN